MSLQLQVLETPQDKWFALITGGNQKVCPSEWWNMNDS